MPIGAGGIDMKTARENRTLALGLGLPEAGQPAPGSVNLQIEMCNLLSTMIASGIANGRIRSRHDLAARMSELTGEEITKSMLDSWTAESKDRHRFPYEYAPAFEIALDNDRLQELYIRKGGRRTHVGREAAFVELGELQAEEDRIAHRKKELRKELRNKR